MKKSLLSFLALAGVLVGCQNYDDQFDALNQEILRLSSELDGLEDAFQDIERIQADLLAIDQAVRDLASNGATQQQLTDEIARILAELAALESDLEDQINNIDIETAVTSATTSISDEVDELNLEIERIEAALADLLDAAAVIEQDVRIRNLPELEYAETLFSFESGQVTSVIVKGNVTIDLGAWANTHVARVQSIATMIRTIIQGTSGGNLDFTSTQTTAIDFTYLTFIDGGVTLVGPADITAVQQIEGNLSFEGIGTSVSFPDLTSVGDVIITDASDLEVLNLEGLTGTAGRLLVGTGASSNVLNLPDATQVRLGTLAIPTMVTLNAGTLTSASTADYSGTISATAITLNNTAEVSNSVLTSSGAIVAGDVASTTITTDGTVRVASVSGQNSNTTITGDGITITGAAVASVLTLNGGDISTGVVSVSSASAFTGSNTTIEGTNGSATLTINATGDADVTVTGDINSALDIADAADVTFSGSDLEIGARTDVTYSGEFSGNGIETISNIFNLTDTGTGHALELPALETVSGVFTANDITSFTANALTVNSAAINTDSATTFIAESLVVSAAISLEDATTVAFATATSTFLTAADSDDFVTYRLHALDNAYNFNDGNHDSLEDVTIIGKANADLTLQANPVTFGSTNGDLETLTVQGYISDLTVDNTPLESLVTTTDAYITTLRVTNNASLSTLTTGHQHIQPGDASDIIVTSNTSSQLLTLDFSSVTKVQYVEVTGNDSVTSITAPSATGLLAEPLANIDVTVSGAGLSSTYTTATAPTGTTSYVAAEFTTSSISGFRAFIEAYQAQAGGSRSGTVSYSFNLNTTGLSGDTAAVNGPDNVPAGTDGQHDGDATIDNDTMEELELLSTSN
ncbi:MAG: hypothetical protein ACON42_06965 [Flavobacteriaceae bacterium]